ncbi:hypothetical protein GF377_05565 [candidate division GN15 bacterium]|nr:hypothetical protein [candidate division GN15 bacterium]
MLTELARRWPLLQGLIDFVYPPLCAGCGEFDESQDSVCQRCINLIDWYASPFEISDAPAAETEPPTKASTLRFPLFAGGDYVDPLKRLVIQYKFHGVIGLADFMADRMAETYAKPFADLLPATLVPIPLHAGREYTRGYNQALVFAKALARRTDFDIDHSILVRTKRRRPQARLKQADREHNIEDVFGVTALPDESGVTRVVLVDDVVTSGATVREAKKTLEDFGYKVIAAISMAHGV